MHLLIDTSTEQGLLAFFEGNRLLKEKILPLGQKNSSALMPLVAELFEEEKVLPDDLSYVAVGLGPGSYTGIRVGLVVAKMIAYSAKKVLVGVPSLTAFFPDNDGNFTAILDARIAGAYALRGKREGEVISWEKPFVAPLSTLTKEPLFVTPHRQLQEKLEGEFIFTPPRSEFMGQLANQLYIENRISTEVLYLRPTQAEIELGTKD